MWTENNTIKPGEKCITGWDPPIGTMGTTFRIRIDLTYVEVIGGKEEIGDYLGLVSNGELRD